MNNGYIPEEESEMKEIARENIVSNGKAHQIGEEESERNLQKITHIDEVINKNIEENNIQKSSTANPETIGRKSVDEKYAIGLLDEVINKEEENELTIKEIENEVSSPVIDTRKISIDAESLNSNNVHVIGSDFALVHREDIPESIKNDTNITNEESLQQETIEEEDEINENSNPYESFDEIIENKPAETNQSEPLTIKEVVKEDSPKPPSTPPMPPPPVPLRSPNKRNFTIPAKNKGSSPSPQNSPNINNKQNNFPVFIKAKSATSSPQSSPNINNLQRNFFIPSENKSFTSSPEHSPNISRQMSQETLDDPQLDDHIKMGSKSHNAIASKLERILQQRSNKQTKGLTKPVSHQEEEEAEVIQNLHPPDVSKKSADLVKGITRLSAILKEDKEEKTEGVDEEGVVKPSDFKRKLNEIISLRASTIKPKKRVEENISSEMDKENKEETNEIVQKTYEPEDELVKKVMGNVFQSIKLRKVDSFKID